MVLRRRIDMEATSRADDPALRALAGVVVITAGENVRIVGGQMDAAITTELAGSGVLDDRLVARGWVPRAGNHYVRPVPELGIPGRSGTELVPSLDGRFRPSQHGGRA